MTTSQTLLDLVVDALRGTAAQDDSPVYATGAGARIYAPGDWPTQDGQYPIIKLRVPQESKQSLGRGGPPEFIVSTTVRIVGEVSVPADVNDAGASAASVELWQLARQIEIAIIGSYPLSAEIQQFTSVNSQLSYNSDAETHLAGIQIDVVLEFYQGPDDFAPIAADPLEGADVAVTNYAPLGATIDLPQQ